MQALNIAHRIRPEILRTSRHAKRTRRDERNQFMPVDGPIVPVAGMLQEISRHPMVVPTRGHNVDRLPVIMSVHLGAGFTRATRVADRPTRLERGCDQRRFPIAKSRKNRLFGSGTYWFIETSPFAPVTQ